MKDLIQIIAKFWTEKISLHVSHHPQNILLRCMEMFCTMCSKTLRSNKSEVDGSPKENKMACFTNSKGSFQVLDLVRDF